MTDKISYPCMHYREKREIDSENAADYNKKLQADMDALEKICTDFGGVQIPEQPFIKWNKNTPPQGEARFIDNITSFYLVDGIVVEHVVNAGERRTKLMSKRMDFENSIGFMAAIRTAYGIDIHNPCDTTSTKWGKYDR